MSNIYMKKTLKCYARKFEQMKRKLYGNVQHHKKSILGLTYEFNTISVKKKLTGVFWGEVSLLHS